MLGQGLSLLAACGTQAGHAAGTALPGERAGVQCGRRQKRRHQGLAPPSFTRMTSWSPPPRGRCTPWARTARPSLAGKAVVRGRLGFGSSNPPPPPPSRHPTVVGNGCLGSCIPWGWGRGCLGWPCPPQGGERHLGQLNPPGLAWSVLGVAVSPRGSVGPLGAVPPPPAGSAAATGDDRDEP